jgi:hypothetical protein
MDVRNAPDLKQTRRDPAQGPPDLATKFAGGTGANKLRPWGALQERWAMKLFTGWVISAGLVFTAAAANAQVLVPYGAGRSYVAVSDFGGPYAAMPEEAPVVRYGPTLLPAPEVYTIVRENGFSPLGIPQQRGFVYTIAVMDPDGEDGRLVIDARTGRILRFMPAYRMGDHLSGDLTVDYGPVGSLPPPSPVRGYPRPPASIPHVAGPHVASRMPAGVPVPREAPPRPAGDAPHTVGEARPAAGPVAAPAQQSAAVETRPAAPPILPTQEMPKVQGLD